MADSRRVSVRLLVAGKATATGQKVHNLLAGTAELPREVEILAFVDSDVRPIRPGCGRSSNGSTMARPRRRRAIAGSSPRALRWPATCNMRSTPVPR